MPDLDTTSGRSLLPVFAKPSPTGRAFFENAGGSCAPHEVAQAIAALDAGV